jgi:hypothetical protein
MLRHAIFAGRLDASPLDASMLADTIGLLSVDMSADMDMGLGLASQLALPMRVLIFLPALARGMYGWAGLGFFAADIAVATATGRLPGSIAAEDSRAAGSIAAGIADAANC